MDHYATEEEVLAIVAGFEQCTTGKAEFNHIHHLTVAVFYVRNGTADEAFQKMRDGLFHFLDHHSVDRAKYQEDVTRKWIALVQEIVEQMNAAPLVTVTNAVLARLGDSRMVT